MTFPSYKETYVRISREQMYSQIIETLAERATCARRKVGSLIARDGRILSTGYNGSPSHAPHCLDVGCLIDPQTGGCIRTLHAEANTIAFAARYGISTEGAEIYSSCTPCLSCAKLIVNAGIVRFIAFGDYRDPSGVELLQSVNIPVEIWPSDSVHSVQ